MILGSGDEFFLKMAIFIPTSKLAFVLQ